MGSPADEVYIQLKHAKQLCEYEYKLAFNSWDGKRVEQWHRCLNAVSAAMDAFLPLRESPLAEPAEITLEPIVDTPNSIGPLAETENMQWEIRPVVDYTAESHSVVVPRDDLVACLRRITKFRKKPARRELLSVSMRDGLLRFAMLNVSSGVEAYGMWMSDVIVNASIIFNIAQVPPKEKEVSIIMEAGKLHIGTAVAPVLFC